MGQLWEEAGPFPDHIFLVLEVRRGFLGDASGEEPVCQYRRHETWIRSLGRGDFPGGGHGNPL